MGDRNLVHIPAVETHLVTSRIVTQTFKIEVMQPARTRGDATRFPVVYVTDGNFTFDALKGISYCMQSSRHDVAQFILVGISYPSDCPEAGAVLRGRDMSFPGYPTQSTVPPPIEGVLVAPAGTKDQFGGEEFQQFLAEELIPFVDRNYPTIAGERSYFGHSLGASFGLSTLFTRSELFRGYIISSPGLSIHGETSAGIHCDNYDFLIREARQFIASEKSLRDTKVYISVGTEEEFEPGIQAWQLTSSFYRMAAVLKAANIPGLSVTTEAFSGETHMTVWPLAFIHGVQMVLGK